jgi:hypothetical protein
VIRYWMTGALLIASGCPQPDGGEQPVLVFGCEEGHVAAYLVVPRSHPTESGLVLSGSLDESAVRVQLDSTPPCTDDVAP